MNKFHANKTLMFEELKSLVDEQLSYKILNESLEEEISEVISGLRDKRRLRKMKYLKEALNEYVKSMDKS